MRILTVGMYGLPSGEYSDLIGADVFQDYDAVVINPESIENLFSHSRIEYSKPKERILNTECGQMILGWSVKRRLEVHDLLQKGGVVVTFMHPILTYQYGEDSEITNYDWLFGRKEIEEEFGYIILGTGTTIKILDTGHPFSEYLNLKPSWSAFIRISRCNQSIWNILASAFDTHALSLVKKVDNGYIVLIPSYYSREYGTILEKCIEVILTIVEPSPVPDWVKPIIVPGQETLNPKLSELNKAIEKLQNEAKQVDTDIQQLERWKYLLYERGTHFLQPMVRNALSLIGFNDKSDTEQIADGFFNCEYGDAILEVEGSKDSIKIEKISQLIRDRANYIEDKKCTSPKGILVGNPFREQPLDNRPPEGSNKPLFTKELIQTAEKQDIVVILSTDLYNIVSLFLRGQISDERKQEIRKLIFESTGLLKLS